MTAYFADIFSEKNMEPAIGVNFFTSTELTRLKKYFEERECPKVGVFPPPCNVNLFFGFFFDGTNNNLRRDRKLHTHSNVARLYSAFPGGKDNHGSEAWPDLNSRYYNFFRTYIPGVGTAFDDVGDSGEGSDRTRGLACSYLGENRIIWALVEAINHVHRYYTNKLLISPDEFKKKFNWLALPSIGAPASQIALLEAAFTEALQRLHEALNAYLPLGDGKLRDKGVVTNIYCSMFGFSRGATKARAFANWFIWLCKLDAKLSKSGNLSLGTIPVTIDFIGLFDTVASVGLAAILPMADGHQAWADTESSLRIPPESAQCLHLVSAHEIRRSFPLDSVLNRGALPANCTEIVFPGVHSDIGGGYAPLEQGRGTDPEGADLISRIALATMYRAARLAGVPLKLEQAPQTVQRAFRIAPRVIRAFNAYIGACKALHDVAPDQQESAPLHELMARQHRLYIQWRKKIRGKMAEMRGFDGIDKHDKLDLLEADKELRDEIDYFERWRRDRYHGEVEQRCPTQEWEDIDHYWDQPPPSAEVCDLFEHFVHDSRAWFKPLGKDVGELQEEMESLARRRKKAIEWEKSWHDPGVVNPYLLTASQNKKLDDYLGYKEKYPDSDDRAALTPESSGREPMSLGGGYLRYRRIYMGSDSFRPSGAQYASAVPDQERRAGEPLQIA